jgi:uncharacterized protein YndB with AHSA1/START domain
MTTNAEPATGQIQPPSELVLTRLIDAPRELVYQAWTDPAHLAQWWGPRSFTNPVCEIDLRPGGAILIHMQGPDGSVFPMKGTFEEIVSPERLVFVSSAIEDENGVPALEARNTVLFEVAGGKTKLTVIDQVTRVTPDAAFAIAGMEQGWNESLDKLVEFMESTGKE